MAGWVKVPSANQRVLTATNFPTVAWKNIDLSPWVGSSRAWVLLTINPHTGNSIVAFRPSDDADDYLKTAATIAQGTHAAKTNSAAGHCTFLVQTGPTGIVQWLGLVAQSANVDILGFVTGVTASTLDLHNGAVGFGWSSYDASAQIAGVAMCLLKDEALIAFGGAYHCARTQGDLGVNWENTACSNSNKQHGTTINTAEVMAGESSSGGIVDVYSSGATNVDLDLLGYVQRSDGYLPPIAGQETIYPHAVAPGGYTDLDVSAALGYAQPALLFIRVESFSVNGCAIARCIGDGYEIANGRSGITHCNPAQNRAGLLIVDCDEIGIFEWKGTQQVELTLIGYIPEIFPPAPSVVRALPSGPTTEEPTTIELVVDSIYALDPSTLELKVKSPIGAEYIAITGGVVQAGFTGTITVTTTRVDVRLTAWPSGFFESFTRWGFEAEIEDILGQGL